MNRHEQGLTLVEILFTLAVTAILLLGLNGLVGSAYEQWRYSNERQELLAQGNFAMARISQAVNATRRVLLPLADNPLTVYAESRRNVLAVTLDPGLDRDADGVVDADNDKDGLIDEDLPADNTFDGAPGLIGIDDNNDGLVDVNIGGAGLTDNDEDGQVREDCKNGVDDDLDGSIDEDMPAHNVQDGGNATPFDNDGDGAKGEDWLDPVVYLVSADGKQLLERLPNLNPLNGAAATDSPLAEAAKITLAVERLPVPAGARAGLLVVKLLLSGQYGGDILLENSLRVGGGK